MKPKLYLLSILIILYSCQGPKQNKPASQAVVTSSKPNPKPTLLYDTTGLGHAPIKILSAKISSTKLVDTVDQPDDNLHHEGHFGRYIMVKVKFKNVSSKRIVGTMLRWLIVDDNGKPTQVDTIKNGWEMGYMGTLAPYGNTFGVFSLGIGKTREEEWEYPSKAGKKVNLAFASEVEFYDNIKWKIGN